MERTARPGTLRAVAENSSKAVVVAVGADLLVGVAKGIAAVLSGSASMAAECGHSLVDAASHPFGYGAQLYFWALCSRPSSSAGRPCGRSSSTSTR